MRYELKIALRYLRARRKEAFISVTTIFTAIGVMIGVAALTITLAVMGGFEQSFKQSMLSVSPQIRILSAEGSIAKYSEIEARAAAVAGVNGTDPFIIERGMLSSGRGVGGVLVHGVEPDNRVVDELWGRYMIAGGFGRLLNGYTIATPGIASKQSNVGAIAVGSGVAEKLKVKIGDPVRIVVPLIAMDGSISTRTGGFVVGAIFESGLNYIDANLILMDLQRAQEFFGRGDKVDGIEVHLANLDDTVAVTAALRKTLGRPYYVQNWIEINEFAAAGWEILKRLYSLVLVMLIGVAAFNLVATLIMVVMEKRKDIAVLIAMGATPRDVRRIFVLKGMIVGAAGTLAGLIIGAAGCFTLARYHFIHIQKEIYGMSTPPIAAHPLDFALVALASLALCLIATYYPARKASREMPVEVFRS
ncbi:MAG TPA: ABC transporter permease [Candidatus Binataceae bacterium]|nr:ABC transporter permease [Candidatus Binataceae bacterium]